MLIESFSQAILRWLRIPPGTSIRKAGEVSTSSSTTISDNPYIDAIVDITVDDICIGEEPLSINFESYTPDEVKQKLQEINDEFNTVVKDVAWDLCTLGFSCYTCAVNEKNKLKVLPYLDPVQFYLTKDKEIVAVDEDDNPIEDLIIFINYNRRSLQQIEDDNTEMSELYVFKVNPTPMQLNNAQSTVDSLTNAENNLDRYRSILSRIARWANVDVGMSQGDQIKDTIDTISSAINANSSGLTSFDNSYDDNIPIIPNRKGLGKPELEQNIPDYNLKDLGDIDYYLSKLNLLTRFPATYIDFSKNLDETAASLIRGDLRYCKLCNKVRTKIIKTLNEFVNASEKFRKYQPCFTLTQLPTSEDEDVMEALGNYVDLAGNVENFVMGEEPLPSELRLHRLQLLQDLFASSTTSPALQKWFEDYREFIAKFEDAEPEMGGEGMPMEGGEGGDLDLGEGGEGMPGEGGEGEMGEVETMNPNASIPDVEFFDAKTE